MEEFENIDQSEDFNIERRANGTEVFTEPYSKEAMHRLKRLVLTFYWQGERKNYSIHVDGETVVERTSDGRKFNRYVAFVDRNTRTVEVKMYKGQSFNCNRHVFVINHGLSGAGEKEKNMQEEIEKALEAQEKENELIYLRTELEKKERKLKKLKKIATAKEEKLSMGEVKNFLIEGKGLIDAFRGNGGSQLGDVHQEPDSEVTIEAEDQEASEEQEIFNQLYAHVGSKGIKKTLNIMKILSEHPELEGLLVKELNKKEEGKNGKS